MKTKLINFTNTLGLKFGEPLIRLFSGDTTPKNISQILKKILVPILTILLFFFLWGRLSSGLQSMAQSAKYDKELQKSGKESAERLKTAMQNTGSAERPKTFPSPGQVGSAYESLWAEHKRINKEKKIFQKKWAKKNAQLRAQNKNELEYTGRSFVDQIKTSLYNVFSGFLLAMIIAVPIGIVMGLSEAVRDAINPVIQIFKPVSPVVWYLMVYMIVTTLIPEQGADSNAVYYITFISVGLCAMWATLINTAVGVASVDKDIINVSKVLKLGTFQHVFKVILPAAIPLIFTGLRITMSVSWMVLIAIELLSQSPGLGTFVWEEYQSDGLDSNAKIMAAMFVIGAIGFLLDRIMLILQNLVSFEEDKG